MEGSWYLLDWEWLGMVDVRVKEGRKVMGKRRMVREG